MLFGNVLSEHFIVNMIKFFTYPAAKTNHHAFESGLAYHTATMVRLADSIGDVYPQLNKAYFMQELCYDWLKSLS